jgi:hypothetical protein
MLGLLGLGSEAMTMGIDSQASAFTQVNRAEPEPSLVRATSDDRRRATSLLGSALAFNAGYYVPHADPERAEGGVEGEDLTASS